MTERERLLKLAEQTFARALAIMREKNAKYATRADPILNYRRAAQDTGALNVGYILGRMSEKQTRWKLTATERDEINDAASIAAVNIAREEAPDIANLCVLALWAMGARPEEPDAQA